MATNVNSLFNMGGGSPTVAEGYETNGKAIKKLKTFVGSEKIRIYGYLITKDAGYGRGVLLCADAALISLPKRYEAIFEEFNDNQKEVMRSGRLFIDNIREVQTERGTTVTFDLIKED